MPRYSVIIAENISTEVIEDIEFPDAESARHDLVKGAGEMLVDGVLQGVDRTGWVAHLFDDEGHHLSTVKFADFLEAVSEDK